MQFDILTLFPEMFHYIINTNMFNKAIQENMVKINIINIRKYAFNKHKRCDDTPYGGHGMLLLAEPLYQAYKRIYEKNQNIHTVFCSPCGKTFNQKKAFKLLNYDHIVFVCGHYEGIDQRFIDLCVDEEISIGDFIVSGGELPSMLIMDSMIRLIPGVLKEKSCTEESHSSMILEYPQYTRPRVWKNLKVPEVLFSGHHKKINDWKQKQSFEKTVKLRPDLVSKKNIYKKSK